jgi:2-polyprenyl-6-hydroxyphenyl methylase/3-demethylubiquinone-9 3-methyltransferase
MPTQPRLSEDELRDFYRGDYVARYHSSDTGRLQNIMKHIHLSKDDHVVDYASGNSLLLEFLKPFPALYTGVDFSEEFINEAKKRYQDIPGKIEFFCQDIVEFCQSHPSQFDWAFALDFSEHIYDEQFVTIFGAMASTLQPDGTLVLHTPNAEFLLERLKARNWILKQYPQHVRVRNAQEHYELLMQAGFHNIKIIFLPHYSPRLRFLALFQDWPILRRFLRARILITAQPNRS